jgi:hypothetical protein
MQTITERTEEFLSATACRARLAVGNTAHAVGNAAHAIRSRVSEERGQISAEFMGLLFIVALVIGAIVALGIHTTIADAINTFINNIKGGQSPAGAPAAPTGEGPG